MADSHQDSKFCILQAAAKLFAKLGLDKCSTREIAKESKSNISAISYHFGGKEGLYREVMRQCALEIKDHVQLRTKHFENAAITKELFQAEMQALIDSLIFFQMKYPEVSQIFAREKLTCLKHSKEIHEEIFYPLVKNFIHMFQQAQAAKIVRPEINPTLYFIMLSEGTWGFFELQKCPTPLLHDLKEFVNNADNLKNQISKIFIEGALL